MFNGICRIGLCRITEILVILIIFVSFDSFAQSELPVIIKFDQKSQRIDLKTEKILPEYKSAERGSIQFYMARLDSPDDFIHYTHDGINKAEIKDLQSMEKVQGQFAIWRLTFRSGSINTPRIQHLAVSFIPLSRTSKEPEAKVYLLLDDLECIDWGERDK